MFRFSAPDTILRTTRLRVGVRAAGRRCGRRGRRGVAELNAVRNELRARRRAPRKEGLLVLAQTTQHGAKFVHLEPVFGDDAQRIEDLAESVGGLRQRAQRENVGLVGGKRRGATIK